MFNGNFMKTMRLSNAAHQNNLTQGNVNTMNGFGNNHQQPI